ncbi:MAG TPA: glycosyltransferase [Candidatus Saccharimonadales bacterium]|nr:glycosyltransferase [Candidatus Saccharimonadales bacterium]
MMIMVSLLVAGALVEAVLYVLPFLWPGRKAVVPVVVATTAFAGAGLFVSQPNTVSFLILLLCAYRIFNNIRVMENRMHERYLRRATRRTSLKLLAPQLVLGALWFGWHQMNLATHALWALLAFWQVVVAAVLFGSTLRSLNRTLPRPIKKSYSTAELPSITIAVPARNETEDLQQCLESLIASDYPKLEIIVLDDCSQIRQTPEIIRSFAHDGVRFVKGAEPSDTWLPKNQAYQRLAEEASGEYILFCGVDVRFEPDAVRKLVTAMLARQKTMVSVLPGRARGAGSNFALVQAMRNWWELVPPRRLFERPPVMSSCWIISRATLKKVGGFEAVTRSIVPEAYFAKQLVWQDRYSFLRSDDMLGITTAKAAREQRATAVRMRYPQVHRRPEQVWLVTMLEFAFLLLPFAMAVGGFWWHVGLYAQALAAVAGILLVTTYVAMATATSLNGRWFRVVAFPLVVLTDIGLLHYSMWQYEFSVVDWKGRNVCIPAMHAIPHLPKI